MEKKWLVRTVTQSHKCFILRKTYYFGIMQSALCVPPIASHRLLKRLCSRVKISKNNFTASTRIFFCKEGTNHRCAERKNTMPASTPWGHCLSYSKAPALLYFTVSVPAEKLMLLNCGVGEDF